MKHVPTNNNGACMTRARESFDTSWYTNGDVAQCIPVDFGVLTSENGCKTLR